MSLYERLTAALDQWRGDYAYSDLQTGTKTRSRWTLRHTILAVAAVAGVLLLAGVWHAGIVAHLQTLATADDDAYRESKVSEAVPSVPTAELDFSSSVQPERPVEAAPVSAEAAPAAVEPQPSAEVDIPDLKDIHALEDSHHDAQPAPAPASKDACLDIPAETIATLVATTKPLISVIQNGSLVDVAKQSIPASSEACVVVTLPQKKLADNEYVDRPHPTRGPDVVHLYLNSTDVIITLPALKPLARQPHAHELYSATPIVYGESISFGSGGNYSIHGSREYSNWHWEMQYHQSLAPGDFGMIYPEIGQIPATYWPWDYYPENITSTHLAVDGPPRLTSKPRCSDTTTAAQGRWHRYASFPGRELDGAAVDEWGYFWDGDHCELDFFSAGEVMQCLAHKSIHVYGDSNLRRLSKSIVSGGRWCREPTARCQDEDDNHQEPVYEVEEDGAGGLNMTQIERLSLFQGYGPSSLQFGHNSSLHFSFLTQTANNTGMWMDRLYDRDDLIVQTTENETHWADRAVRAGARARAPTDLPPADLVILGMGSWDQAFADRFDAYEAQTAQLAAAAKQAYGDTPMALRLSNSFCCRAREGNRRFNGARIAEFDDRTRKAFGVEGAAGQADGGRIRVVDPMRLNGRPDVIFDHGASRANHPRMSHVRVEMQMMLNSLCERDPATGRVAYRRSSQAASAPP